MYNGTKVNLNAAAYLLAAKLDAFAEKYDTYDYYDVVEDRESAIRDIAKALLHKSKYLDGIKDYLRGVIEDDRWYVNKARELLKEIEDFEKSFIEKGACSECLSEQR